MVRRVGKNVGVLHIEGKIGKLPRPVTSSGGALFTARR